MKFRIPGNAMRDGGKADRISICRPLPPFYDIANLKKQNTKIASDPNYIDSLSWIDARLGLPKGTIKSITARKGFQDYFRIEVEKNNDYGKIIPNKKRSASYVQAAFLDALLIIGGKNRNNLPAIKLDDFIFRPGNKPKYASDFRSSMRYPAMRDTFEAFFKSKA
jgi:hypothetical protein